MKKIFVFGLIASLVPCIGFAENPQITRLMREKQNKIEQLEKCMGSTKGLKIAGISTLGLTAVGVAGNIAEASAIKKYDSQIEATDKKIEKTQQEIDEKLKKIEKKEEAEAEARKQERMLKNVVLADINTINNSGNIGDRAVSHGYMPEQLPENLRSQFANAMVNFIARCRANIGQNNGIKEVSLSPSVQENWRQYVGGTPLTENLILTNLNEHIIAECKITQCDLVTHNVITNAGNMICVSKTGTTNTGSNNGGNSNGVSGDNQSNGLPNSNISNGGIDCLAEAKKTEPDATSAKTNANGVCELLTCDFGMVPDTAKKTCVYPNEIPTVTVKKCDASVLTSLHATAGTEKEGGCFVQKCESGYHLELNGRKYKVNEFQGVDLNMKCIKDAPVLPNDATKVATKTIIEPLQKTPMLQSQPGKSDVQIACEKVGTFVEYRNLGSTRCTISGVGYHRPEHCDTIPKGRWHPVNSQYCEYDGG